MRVIHGMLNEVSHLRGEMTKVVIKQNIASDRSLICELQHQRRQRQH